MSETNQPGALDKVKNLFHENIGARTEITGGTWDAAKNVYTTKDETTGITTEYKLKKNKLAETGLHVTAKYYKDEQQDGGQTKRTEMMFDKKMQGWKPKSDAAKALDFLPHKHTIMATLNQSKGPNQEPMFTLVIEPMKHKTRVLPVPVRV